MSDQIGKHGAKGAKKKSRKQGAEDAGDLGRGQGAKRTADQAAKEAAKEAAREVKRAKREERRTAAKDEAFSYMYMGARKLGDPPTFKSIGAKAATCKVGTHDGGVFGCVPSEAGYGVSAHGECGAL
jgi:hypothetical protein